MPRRAAKVDANQREIVAALRDAHVSVEPLHAVGGGVPDLLYGARRPVCCPVCRNTYMIPQTGLMEIKDGNKPPSARKLTSAQVAWHASWRGSAVGVVRDIQEALDAALGRGHA